jgi:hypothetical protein
MPLPDDLGSGDPDPARVFVMTGIVFAAILIDGLRLSMRICVLAVLVRECGGA